MELWNKVAVYTTKSLTSLLTTNEKAIKYLSIRLIKWA